MSSALSLDFDSISVEWDIKQQNLTDYRQSLKKCFIGNKTNADIYSLNR